MQSKFSLKDLVHIWLLSALAFNLFGNFTRHIYSVPSGNVYGEEITGLPFWARIVDVDSQGRIFVLSSDNDVWRSTDSGFSWVKLLEDGYDWGTEINVTTRNWLTLYIDSQDRIFTNLYGMNQTFFRSIDNGDSWEVIVAGSRRSWHMDEASNGSLYRHDYSAGWSAIYKSDDGGVSWTVFQNFSTLLYGGDLRTIAVNDYNDEEVWCATNCWIKYWNGSSWITVQNDTTTPQVLTSAIWFDSNRVYMGSENVKYNWRYSHAAKEPSLIPERGTDIYWDTGSLTYVSDKHSFEGIRIDDMMFFGIRSQLWGTWDGDRWVKIVDFGDGINHDIMSISRRRPLYFTDKNTGKLYRLNIQKEDIIKLYYAEFNLRRGSITNAENYVLEQRIGNGTNYLDLTCVALTNVQASIKGLSRNNELDDNARPNAGFELGDKTGWTDVGSVTGSVVTEDKANGTYSLKYNISSTQTALFRQADFITVKRGELLRVSTYIKGNVTSKNRVSIYLNPTSYSKSFTLTTSWQRVSMYFVPSAVPISGTVKVRPYFRGLSGIAYTLYWDSILAEVYEVGTAFSGGEGEDDIAYFEKPFRFHIADINTTNPTITINGQQISHSGQLANGTESSATSLSGILTGAVQVSADIQGSGQAILRITGTRIVSLTNTVLNQRTSDGIYIGRYYATPTVTTNVTDFIALTNKEANITSTSYVLNKLNLTINSPSGTTSTTLIYVDDKGEPPTVSGATTWSYNNETKIVTTNILHTGPQQVTLDWTDHNPPTTTIHLSGVQGNKGWFTSNVIVTLSATDDISGVNQTEYSFDNATWTTYMTPFTVSTEGYTVVYYKSTDKDANAETIKTETIKIDKTVPSGSITINNGDAYINSLSVTLTLSAEDTTSDVAQMRFSNDGINWSDWEPYTTSKTWTLTIGDGTKTVYIEFMDNAGLVSQYQDAIILDTTQPTANAGANQTVNEDTLVTFDGSASQDENEIASCTWTFTDITIQILSSKSPTYTFNTPDVYTITLNVTDAIGNWATDTVVITVLDITKPTANAGQNQTVNVGTTVTFNASNSTDNVGIVSYQWNFGDGTTGVGISTTHIYTSPETYIVTLTVKDATGNTATHSKTIMVLPAEMKETGTQTFPMWAIGVIVAVIGAVLAITLLIRRRK